MQRNQTKAIVILASIVVCFALGQSARAAIAVTNGDFESPNVAINAVDQNVPNWFDSTGNFTSWHQGEDPDPQENGTQILAIGPGGGAAWVYQSLGTLDSAGGTLNWSLDKSRFDDGNASAGLNVRFYYGNPIGTPADGTAIGSLGGLTQVGSTAALQDFGSNSVGTGSMNESGSIDLTGLSAGTQLWMQLEGFISNVNYVSGGTNGFAPFDNIVATHVAAPSIPTPGALPVGLAMGLAIVARRRTH